MGTKVPTERQLVVMGMKEDLEKSGLDGDKTIKSLGVKPLTAEEISEETGYSTQGYSIPYYDINGTKLPFYRIKFLIPPKSNPKQKYWQPENTRSHFYFPRTIKGHTWKTVARDPTIPITFTEGEKKAACACLHGIACIGLGGVWAWRSKKSPGPVVEEFNQFEWRGRNIEIVFDSDVIAKPEVMQALQALTEFLRAKGVNKVQIRSLPATGDKTGMDDYIVEHGIEKFQELPILEDELQSALHVMNSQYAYIRTFPGKVFNQQTRLFHSYQGFTGLDEAVRSVYVVQNGKPAKVSVAKSWMEWPNRTEYDGLVFEPAQPNVLPDGNYNLWEDWPVKPRRGKVQPFIDLVNHVFPDPDVARWFWQWLAYPLQNPGTKLYSAVVVWGERQGTGKSFIGEIMCDLYGQYSAQISADELHSGFNDWAEHKLFVMADEISDRKDKRGDADRIKRMVTRESYIVNRKFQPTYRLRDYANYYFTSNSQNALYIERFDRRFMVQRVEHVDPKLYPMVDAWRYENSMQRIVNQQSLAALMYYLLNMVSLEGFNPKGEPPMTEDKEEMQMSGFSSIETWAHALSQAPDQYLKIAGTRIERDLFNFEQIMALLPDDLARISNRVATGMALRKFFPKKFVNMAAERITLYALRNPGKWEKSSHSDWAEHYQKHMTVSVEDNVVSIRSKITKEGGK